MALFKIVRGKSEDLPETYHDGYAYFCTDTGAFYIDYKENESDTEIKRRKISASSAERLIPLIEDDANFGSSVQPIYFNEDGVPKATAYQLNATVPTDAQFTDTKVTSVDNHYTPVANNESQLSVSAIGGESALWNETNVVTGINIQRDAKGHMVGITVDSVKMPTDPNENMLTAVRFVEQTLDEAQKTQARINIGAEYTREDAINLLAEMEIISPMADSDGNVLTDEDNNILSL